MCPTTKSIRKNSIVKLDQAKKTSGTNPSPELSEKSEEVKNPGVNVPKSCALGTLHLSHPYEKPQFTLSNS